MKIFKQGPIELRCGRWQDVLADVESCDAVITDPPYGARTHAGERGLRTSGTEKNAQIVGRGLGRCPRNAIAYNSISESDCREFAERWGSVAQHWLAIFGDDSTFQWWRAALSDHGLMTFTPVVWMKKGAPPRFSGDGPASWCEYIAIARPRRRVRDKGSRPGYYSVLTQTGRLDDMGGSGIVGRKCLQGMKSLIRDYTRPGDLVVDPCAGGATTLIAAAIEGRRALGAEMDPETFAKAVKRIKAGWTPTLF